MFAVRLDAKQCISCGICMDVCAPKALGMRMWRGRTVEGACLVRRRGNGGHADPAAGTFPYMAGRERCDGCLECVRECPVEAILVYAMTRDAGDLREETL